jgi:hypothetical protein
MRRAEMLRGAVALSNEGAALLSKDGAVLS